MKQLRVAIWLGMTALGWSGSGPALACSWMGAPEPVGYPSATFLSKGLYGAAAFVDLAVAETTRPLPGPGENFGTQAITFRVIQRWKGASPDRFVLFGQGLHPDGMGTGGWLRHHWLDEEGRVRPHQTPWESPTTAQVSLSSCDPGFIRPAQGRTYVIFRGADGRLLGPVVHHAGARAERGLEFVEVGHPREDEWLGAVFLRGYGQAGQASVIAPATNLLGHALVTFRTPLDERTAAAVLRNANARPYAVRTMSGEFSDELRLPMDRAGWSILGEALRVARENRAAPPPRDAARTLLKDLTPELLENDGWLRTFAAALVLAEERRARAEASGPSLIGSAEVLADARAVAALRRDARVASVVQPPTTQVQAAAPPSLEGAISTSATALEAQARALSPAFLLHRLRVLAGELPANSPGPARTARTQAPPADTRACRRVDAGTARAFRGLELKAAFAGMRVFGEPRMTCRPADRTRGACTVSGPTRVRLEFASGAVSGFDVPSPGPVRLSIDGTSFGCAAAATR